MHAAVLAVPPALARAIPRLASFLPEWQLVPAGAAPAGATLGWLAGLPGRPVGQGSLLMLAEGPWAPPSFGRRLTPLGLVLTISPGGVADPVTTGMTNPTEARATTQVPDLSAMLTLVPRLPALAALLAGSDLPPEQALARLLAASRFVDPFHGKPWTAPQALAQLAEWTTAEAANRRIVAATGMETFKRPRMRARLANGAGSPRMFWRASAAIQHAADQQGAVVVWAAAMPPDLPARAAAANVPLVQIEDGFIRSAGLGVMLAPAQSLVMDARGAHFDPATPSALECQLATAEFSPALLARSAALRERLLADGITKYNLIGPAPALKPPAGRKRVLVCGQVEDDASLRRGGGSIRTNLDLLRAARRENPDAWLVYKPHPDVEAGIRRGIIRPDALAVLADQVAADSPIAPLYDLADEVQVMSSLAGFEALLRGCRVVCWGQPFYAGWGLTQDRAPIPRRTRRLSLDELVAGTLLLYPRYWDPVSGLPCPLEVLLDRLSNMAPPPPPRLPRWLRQAAARASGWWTLFWVRR